MVTDSSAFSDDVDAEVREVEVERSGTNMHGAGVGE